MCVVCGKGQYCLHHLADLDLKGPFMCSYDDAHALCVCVFVGGLSLYNPAGRIWFQA